MRGLHFALIDEADSVLVDEARTPLIISGAGDATLDETTVSEALELSRRLEIEEDFIVSAEDRRVFLTEQGQQRVEAFSREREGHWRSMVSREELARQALAALHLFNRDEHYVVADGKLRIVDEYTGRIMPDRQWSDGLHQMIERKERLRPVGAPRDAGAHHLSEILPTLPAACRHERHAATGGQRNLARLSRRRRHHPDRQAGAPHPPPRRHLRDGAGEMGPHRRARVRPQRQGRAGADRNALGGEFAHRRREAHRSAASPIAC